MPISDAVDYYLALGIAVASVGALSVEQPNLEFVLWGGRLTVRSGGVDPPQGSDQTAGTFGLEPDARAWNSIGEEAIRLLARIALLAKVST